MLYLKIQKSFLSFDNNQILHTKIIFSPFEDQFYLGISQDNIFIKYFSNCVAKMSDPETELIRNGKFNKFVKQESIEIR